MGNCCGKGSGNFEGEGRTLNAAPANAPAASTGRSAAAPKIKGQGRTLGETTNESQRPGEAAARAAEVRSATDDARRDSVHRQDVSLTIRGQPG